MKNLLFLITLVFLTSQLTSCGNPVEVSRIIIPETTNSPVDTEVVETEEQEVEEVVNFEGAYNVQDYTDLISIVGIMENFDKKLIISTVILFSENTNTTIGQIYIPGRTNIIPLGGIISYNQLVTIDKNNVNERNKNLQKDDCYDNCKLNGKYTMFVKIEFDEIDSLVINVIFEDSKGRIVVNREFNEVL